jgi:transcriptional regulator with XRE-family HTH domain
MIGARIKQARRMAGLSQRGLAAKVGVSAMAVSKWEWGQVYPGSARMMQIADACAVKPGYLLRQTVTLTGIHYAAIPDWA